MAHPAPVPGLVLVLGGSRSGKSEVAERLAHRAPGRIRYLATGSATDEDMAARIEAHRARRGDRYDTVECGADLTAALRAAPEGAVLVDALGTWVAARNLDDRARVDREIDDLVGALVARRAPTVVVSDEVGLGVHPSTEVGRRFRDVLGIVNRRVAEHAAVVLLVVAGRALRLDPLDDALGDALGDLFAGPSGPDVTAPPP